MMLPVPDQAGGVAGVRARLANPADRLRIEGALAAAIAEATQEGAYHQFVAMPSGRYVGMRLLDAAAACGETPEAFAARLLVEEEPYAMLLFHRDAATRAAFPALIRDTIRHPAMMVASDGVYHGPLGHPRGYGCFAQVLRLCVREMGAVSLEAAVHKMSGFPAARFRLRDRGLLREGYGADVIIFDPDTIADRSTWEDDRRSRGAVYGHRTPPRGRGMGECGNSASSVHHQALRAAATGGDQIARKTEVDTRWFSLWAGRWQLSMLEKDWNVVAPLAILQK